MLIYPIMTRVPIDVAMFIFSTMLVTTSHRSSGRWFPSLITDLAMENDTEILPTGEYIVPIHH